MDGRRKAEGISCLEAVAQPRGDGVVCRRLVAAGWGQERIRELHSEFTGSVYCVAKGVIPRSRTTHSKVPGEPTEKQASQ